MTSGRAISLAEAWTQIEVDEEEFDSRASVGGQGASEEDECSAFTDAIDQRITEIIEAPIGTAADAAVKVKILQREFTIGAGGSVDGEKLCEQLIAWLGESHE